MMQITRISPSRISLGLLCFVISAFFTQISSAETPAKKKEQVISYFRQRVTYYQRDNRTPILKEQIEGAKKDGYKPVQDQIDAILVDDFKSNVIYLVTLPLEKETETRSLIGIVTAKKTAEGKLSELTLDQMKPIKDVADFIR